MGLAMTSATTASATRSARSCSVSRTTTSTVSPPLVPGCGSPGGHPSRAPERRSSSARAETADAPKVWTTVRPGSRSGPGQPSSTTTRSETPTSQGREAGDDPRIPVSAADQRHDGAVRVEVREGAPLDDLDGRGAGEDPAVVRQPPRHLAGGDVGAGDEAEHLRRRRGPSGPSTVMAARAAAALAEPSPRLGGRRRARSVRSRAEAVSTRAAASTSRSCGRSPERTAATIASSTACTWSSTKWGRGRAGRRRRPGRARRRPGRRSPRWRPACPGRR